MPERGPRQIRDLVDRGELEPQQAAALYQHNQKRSLLRSVQEPQVERGVYFDRRQEVGRKTRQLIATPIYVAVGAIDGVVDGIAYGISEITEDVAFALSRTTRKAIDLQHTSKAINSPHSWQIRI